MNYNKLNKNELVEKIEELQLDIPESGSGKNGGILKRDLVNVLEKKVEIDNFSKMPPEIARKVLLKLEIDDVIEACNISKYLKEKVCTDYFWQLYTDKNLDDLESLSMDALHENMTLFQVILKNKRFDPSFDDNELINDASRSNIVWAVKLLLKDKRVSPNVAIMVTSSPKITQLFIEDERVDIKMLNEAVIEYTKFDNIESLRVLLKDPRVDPSTYSTNSAIYIASQNGNSEIVKILLKDKRVKIDAHGIYKALKNGHVDTVKIILSNKRISDKINKDKCSWWD